MNKKQKLNEKLEQFILDLALLCMGIYIGHLIFK